jgi:hypothetical protein
MCAPRSHGQSDSQTVDCPSSKANRKKEWGKHILPCSGSHALFPGPLVVHSDSILRERHAGLFAALETASLDRGGRAARAPSDACT